jgi:hypothetical protein
MIVFHFAVDDVVDYYFFKPIVNADLRVWGIGFGVWSMLNYTLLCEFKAFFIKIY